MNEAVTGQGNARVGSGDRPGLGCQCLQVDLGEREASQARAAGTVGETFQLHDDPHLDRRDCARGCQFSQSLADICCVRVLEDDDVFRVAPSGDLTSDVLSQVTRSFCVVQYRAESGCEIRFASFRFVGLWARLPAIPSQRPVWDQYGIAVTASGVVRVLIDPDLDTPRPRPLHELNDGATRAPVIGPSDLDVRGHRGYAGLFGDFDHLDDVIQHRGWSRLVTAGHIPHGVAPRGPLVHDVDPSQPFHFIHQGDHLIGVTPTTRHVLQTRRQPVRSGLHAPPHRVAHRLHFGGSGQATEIVTQGGTANGVVPHHQHDIGTESLFL